MKNSRYVLLFVAILAFAPVSVGVNAAGAANYPDWFKTINAQLRVAATYLRTGNNDFAALALEKLLAVPKPENMKQASGGMVAETLKSVKQAVESIDAGQPAKSRKDLLSLREKLFQFNQSHNIKVFDDCIWGLVKKGPALWYFRKNRPDLADDAQSKKVAAAAAAYLGKLNKCDALAGKETRQSADYQRLFTNAQQSLERIPSEALAQKNSGLLFRFLIELRAIDRLLYFRFG